MSAPVYARNSADRWVRVVAVCHSDAEVRAFLEGHPTAVGLLSNSTAIFVTDKGDSGVAALPAGTCITVWTNQMGGAACVRAMRMPVVTLARQVSEGVSYDAIVRDFPNVTRDDIEAAVWYAQEHKLDLTDRGFELIVPSATKNEAPQ